MESSKELDLDKIVELAQTDQHQCILLLVNEVRRLKKVIHENEEKFSKEISQKDEKLNHKIEKYNKVFNTFSKVLVNNGFGSSHHHFHHSRTTKKFENKEGTQDSDSGSDEFLSFTGDGYESDEDVPKYPKGYINPLDEDDKLLQDKIALYDKVLAKENWTTFPSKGDTELYIYSGDQANGNGVMATGYFDFTPQQMIKFLQMPGEVTKTSPMIENAETIHKFHEDAVCFYMKISKVMIVASRDFLGCSRRYIDSNGHENVIMFSNTDEEYWKSIDIDRPPLTDGTIRGEIIIGGWHFEVEGEKRTKVTNFLINDYKGNVPKMILNMGAPTQATVFKNMKESLAKLEAEGKI